MELASRSSMMASTTRFARYGIDIAVLDIGFDIAPRHDVTLGMGNFFLGADAFLLGYPLDFYNDGHMINNGKPIPLVSKGCISGVQPKDDDKEGRGVYIATSIYYGYSGGPAVFYDHNNKPNVFGIISHNITMKSKQKQENGQTVIVQQPSGIVFVSDIKNAIDLVSAADGNAS